MDVFERIEARLDAIEAHLATIEANIKVVEPRLIEVAHLMDVVEETSVEAENRTMRDLPSNRPVF